MAADVKQIGELVKQKSEFVRALFAEMDKVIVGQRYMLERMLIGLLANGHILLEGVPGLAKTMAVTILSKAINADFKRIQFTPDLLPADLIGTQIYHQSDGDFHTRKGPIFANIILADEINRAPAKVQSALLEAMQERQVTIGDETFPVPSPFFVLATQNPIEQEGTYPLPEAQLDRFFFKLLVPYSNRQELRTILDRTTTGQDPKAERVTGSEEIMQAQELVRHVVIAEHVQDYAIRLVLATHPQGEFAADITNRFVRFGSSPRGVQALVLAGKVRAMLDERYHVSFDDIEASVMPALRHRILLNFEGQAEGITTDEVLEDILANTPKNLEQKLDVP